MTRLVTYDRVKATGVSVSGTSDFGFNGATTPPGFTDINTILHDDLYVPLAIVDLDTGDWEIGLYYYSIDAHTILRGASTVLSNSLGDTSYIDFIPGANKEVSVVNPAFFTTGRKYGDQENYVTRIFRPEAILNTRAEDIFSTIGAATSIVAPSGLAYAQRQLSSVLTTQGTPLSFAGLNISFGSAAFVEYKVFALQDNVTDGVGKIIAGEFLVAYSGGNRVFVGTPTQATLFESAALSTASFDVSITSQGVSFSATGIAGMSIQWLLVADAIYSETS